MRHHCAIVVVVLLVTAVPLLAEAGISEIARARGYWLHKPYALLKSGDKDIGPDTVTLVRGREETRAESCEFFPVGICGIVQQKKLVGQIVRYARVGDYLVAETSEKLPQYAPRQADFAVLRLSDPNATVWWFASAQEAVASCGRGAPAADSVCWQTFESGYYRDNWYYIAAGFGSLGVLTLLPFAALWRLRYAKDQVRRYRLSAKLMCLWSLAAAVVATAQFLFLPGVLRFHLGWLAVWVGVISLTRLRSYERAHQVVLGWYAAASFVGIAVGLFFGLVIPPLLVSLYWLSN